MARLKQAGPVVHLDVDLMTLEQRVAAAPDRGIASDPEQSFADIYRERVPLYQHYADHTVNAGSAGADTIARMIFERLRQAG
jgi:shikimate kinase